MSKRLIIILACAFAVGLTCAAYAEVQNVKVSGDLLMSAMDRSQFDFIRNGKDVTTGNAEDMFLSQIRLKVDADLTDNVSTTLRLINERNWDTEAANNSDIDLDLAYVTLKEFLFSPLTVSIGRQEMRLGNGLVIGASNTYLTTSSAILNGVPSDLSLRKAFDGIKATLNYDPLIVDVLYAKIDETALGTKLNSDINLYGVNAKFLASKKLTADMYLINYKNSAATEITEESIFTVGTLLSVMPIENLVSSLEFAWQFGDRASSTELNQRAYALEFTSNYTFAKNKYTPAIGLNYVYLSGDKDSSDKKNTAWHQMYYDQKFNDIAFAILPFTDVSVYNVKGSIKPKEDLAILASYGVYNLNKEVSAMASNKVDSAGTAYTYTGMTSSRRLGSELDLAAIYDYTEDVQLGLTFGWFKPGKALANNQRSDATQLIGSLKVTF